MMNAENDSTSTPSPSWPTHWPEGAFRPSSVALLIFGVTGLAVCCAIFSFLLYLAVDPQLFTALTHPPVHLPVALILVVQLAFEIPPVLVLLAMIPKLALFSWEQLGLRLPDSRAIFYVIAGFAAALLVGDGGAILIQKVTHHTKHIQDVAKIFEGLHNPATIAAFVLYGVLLAPIAEELIFRGLLFNIGLRYSNFWVAATVSSVLFGAAHADIQLFLPLTLVGFVLATVYYRSRNLLASMLTHASFNAIAFTAMASLKAH